jgi:hypothetical protein
MKTLQTIALAIVLSASLLARDSAGQTRFATLYTFTNGAPVGLTAGNGVLYGATFGGAPNGAGCSTVFALQPPAMGGGPWTESVLHTFTGGASDSCDPIAAPVVGANGMLFGVMNAGGAYGDGAMYQLLAPSSPGLAWTESLAYSFGPSSNLVDGPGGSYYVLSDYPQLLQLQPPAASGGTWTASVLYTFPAAGGPPDSLTAGPNGVLYGTTAWGGSAPGQLGEVFQLTPPVSGGGNWTETVLHEFGYGGTYAGNPNSLTLAGDGTLYGTTYGASLTGGAGRGVVFQLTPPVSPGGTWGYTILKDFGGAHPDSPLILHYGKLYGAAALPTGGVVFELQPPSSPGGTWTTTYLHQFTNGQVPGGTLVMDKAGTLYGSTAVYYSSGTIYRIATQ